jgi:3-oxoadipate enol-lactonase
MTDPAVATALPRWHTGTVPSGGEDIYYEVVEPVSDARATVFLTHGAGGSHAVWYQQVAALAAAAYRVVTWDCRGFGNSTYRSGEHGCAPAVADMTAVLDATGTSDAHLVGQSMGGWWVTAFALAHATRVRSLTLTNTAAGLWTDALEAHFREYVVAAREEALLHAGEHPAVGADHTHEDLAHAFLYQQLNTFHSPPMGDVFKALITTQHRHDHVQSLGIPLLVITSSDDPIFPAPLVCASADRMGAEVVEIERAGHSAYWERPDAFNAALLSFLSRS